MTDYLALEQKYSERAKALHKAGGEPLRAFRGLMQAIGKDAALSHKVKELAALAIGIATRCEGCIVFHTRACLALGVSREELADLIGLAVDMGGGPATVYGAEALACYDQMAAASGKGSG
jgi:AhpD family alkylhydroperoxidase